MTTNLPKIKPLSLFKFNVLLSAACFVELWFLGTVPPWDYVGATGIAWVTISSIESIQALRRRASGCKTWSRG